MPRERGGPEEPLLIAVPTRLPICCYCGKAYTTSKASLRSREPGCSFRGFWAEDTALSE